MKVNPDLYHGQKKQTNFFEGWYFKIVDKTTNYALAIIPGIAKGKKPEDHHSFVQVINAVDQTYYYYRYSVNDFNSEPQHLHIKVADNTFSFTNLALQLKDDEQKVMGQLSFGTPVKWPDSKINPGSMGFYNHFSFMECYSQVCAIDGLIESGKLIVNGRSIDFTGGKYYIEKNWGNSFPSSWVWIQSNSFLDGRATVTCSLGKVPFPIVKSFRGFLIGVTVDQTFYAFTTINRSTLKLTHHNSDLIITCTRKNLELTLKTKSKTKDFLLCYGPKDGKMIPLVEEALQGEVEMKLVDKKNNQIVYSGIGKACGIEYGGKQEEILDAYSS